MSHFDRCKNGIEYDECNEDGKPELGGYCHDCAEERWQHYIEQISEEI